MSESGSDHFSDLEEEVSEVSSPEEREVSPPEGGLFDESIPEVIQSAEPEELLSQDNFLGDFERAYLHRPLNEARRLSPSAPQVRPAKGVNRLMSQPTASELSDQGRQLVPRAPVD
jgi:hypothetical protein